VGRRIELAGGEVIANTGLWPGTFDYRKNMQRSATFEVVGVAADVSEDIVASKKHAAVYFPLSRTDYATPSVRGVTIMVRAVPGNDAIGVVLREIEAIDSRIAPFNARSMTEHISQFMSMLKAATWTYGAMGIFGLVLASIGLAGVTAYSVAKRGHEIGIRVALGAQKSDVLGLVMKEGAVLVLTGSAAGLLLAMAGIRALSGLFFTVATVRGYDPLLLIGAPALLAAVALAACYVPARRAILIDPAVTLRMD
jgi:ABC-type antimicrobial peptide transport system permease subunit